MQWKRCISGSMEKLMYDISKKLTENGENDEKPKFVENFPSIFSKNFFSNFLALFLNKT